MNVCRVLFLSKGRLFGIIPPRCLTDVPRGITLLKEKQIFHVAGRLRPGNRINNVPLLFSSGKVERRNCSEIAITGDASAASPFVFAVMCPRANFKAGMRQARNSPAAMERDGEARTWSLRFRSTTSENLQRTMSQPFDIPFLLDKTTRGTRPQISSSCL